MKLSLIGAGLGLALAVLPTTATAQRWQPINARQATLDARINQGIRSGALNRAEATRLRTDFRALNRLEYRYRASNGLSVGERRDLDRRFYALSKRVRAQKADRQYQRR